MTYPSYLRVNAAQLFKIIRVTLIHDIDAKFNANLFILSCANNCRTGIDNPFNEMVHSNISFLEQAFGDDGSDVESSRDNHAQAEISSIAVDPLQMKDPGAQLEENSNQNKGNENPINEIGVPSALPTGESYRSMGEILSSMDPGHPISSPGLESSSEKLVGKAKGSSLNAKRSTFWGRGNVSYHFMMHCLIVRSSQITCIRHITFI